jgi:hypothetical protein
LLGGRLSRWCSIKKCNGVMPSRLLLFWCLAPCVSCTHQPEDVLDPGGLRALLTCSELRSDLSRTEAQLAVLQQQVDALKHVRDDVSQRLHLCEAQAHIGDTTSQMSSSSPGESVSDTHQNEKCLVGLAPDGRSRGEETGAFTEDRIGRQAPIDYLHGVRHRLRMCNSWTRARYRESRGRLLCHVSTLERLRHATHDFPRRPIRRLGGR